MADQSWASCLTRRGLGELCLTTECPPPECLPCNEEPDCHEQLKTYQSVLRRLLLTKQTVSINDGDRSITYEYSSEMLAVLREEIKDLKLQCGVTRDDCGMPVRTRPSAIRIGA